MEVLQLPSFDDLERDQRKLAFISGLASTSLNYGRKAIDRAEEEAAKESDPVFHWVTRSAMVEAALEILLGHLAMIVEEAKP